ncbi:polymerase [Aureimonas sp. Leaf460]|nr:polymerase [Aureimonas sp. Leaf460]KQT69327.1 polymerase [Aureimonas sp. Leaf427]
MARFYLLALQPTLFGDVSLVRNWGRIGTKGQAKVETFADGAEAKAALGRIERAKRRRGYVEPGA